VFAFAFQNEFKVLLLRQSGKPEKEFPEQFVLRAKIQICFNSGGFLLPIKNPARNYQKKMTTVRAKKNLG